MVDAIRREFEKCREKWGSDEPAALETLERIFSGAIPDLAPRQQSPFPPEAIDPELITLDDPQEEISTQGELRAHALYFPGEMEIRRVMESAAATIDTLEERLRYEREAKDGAYLERNRLVALLSKIFPAGIRKTAIEGWDPAWHNCVFIDLPTGQASWHFHDSHAFLFTHLGPYEGAWDGHATEEKYARIARYGAAQGVEP